MKKSKIYIIVIGSFLIGALTSIIVIISLLPSAKLLKLNNKFCTVLNFVKNNYVDTISVDKMLDDVIPLFINGLDPYSNYFTPEETSELNNLIRGASPGIGADIELLNDSLIFYNIIENSPANKAGIESGDVLLKINGREVPKKERYDSEARQNIFNGKAGSELNLTILSKLNKKYKDVRLVREEIADPSSISASFFLEKEIGYIKILSFNEKTYSDFISKISPLKKKKIKSLIIDLRNNPGGMISQAFEILNEFFESGDTLSYFEGRKIPREIFIADGKGSLKDVDLIVLINEQSASASEIFAGSVQDNDRGLIIGRNSFGKGLVQVQKEFKDGSSIRLTVAKYYLPSGRSIQKEYKRKHSNEFNLDRKFYPEKRTALSFRSSTGRKMIDRAGIIPDIIVQENKKGINSYFRSLMLKGLPEEYGIMYFKMNDKYLRKLDNLRTMYDYLSKQPLVLNLVSLGDNRGIRPRPFLIQDSEKRLQTLVIANIMKMYFGNNGYNYALSKYDPEIFEALKFLKVDEVMSDSIVYD